MRSTLQRRPKKKGVPIYSPADFAAMRRACDLAAATLDFITPQVVAGVTTNALNQSLERFMRDHGAVPATVNYKGYQHASCISVNEVVAHGIPSDLTLVEGDIVNIDVTPKLNGWHGDISRMFMVGNVSKDGRRLVAATYEALMAGVARVRPGATLGDVGWAIEQVARRERLGIVRTFCGHGVGLVFQDAPEVLHYGKPGEGLRLEPGMIFTIEPMLNLGGDEVVILADRWTAITVDRSLSAQWEHSVGVTATGVEVFTLPAAGS